MAPARPKNISFVASKSLASIAAAAKMDPALA
jgi:hypothetical protein